MLTVNYFKELSNSKEVFRANGSFGELTADLVIEENCFSAEKNGICMQSEYK